MTLMVDFKNEASHNVYLLFSKEKEKGKKSEPKIRSLKILAIPPGSPYEDLPGSSVYLLCLCFFIDLHKS